MAFAAGKSAGDTPGVDGWTAAGVAGSDIAGSGAADLGGTGAAGRGGTTGTGSRGAPGEAPAAVGGVMQGTGGVHDRAPGDRLSPRAPW